ncbi:UDP-N-acetylglucosamine 1-carboxyvinyltransferase [Candidatus Arthromitus sp. SFB-rat-Yit]|uniref:UDP-N-acetylglucosamine 1-carboxyvinyltransferase n=1 Tax=Candidatus Arthromitus sp. SFB-rat-Yit TaxID=1041504 RepID=UPI000227A670|nr:UDP-N-acetylglucosamine 1-carboxyvinyltransferase [Candidatus Arthromitus sp. SFB-rat-Yit]BAK81666.1 UDP-N-acetylglucosamine 1-carboxyvinyltransferase [Candidatus Arthromitus sp. SFB-rat-Yit]
MQRFRIRGGRTLNGEIEISSAKNSVLPIIAATILCDDECIIENVPMLDDVFVICDVLKSLKVNVSIDVGNRIFRINSKDMLPLDLSENLIRKMRASFLVLGPLVSRFGKACIYMPGGCNIGLRPIDLHLKGLAALGADISIVNGCVEIIAKRLVGSNIYLDFPSVGATENLIMAATLAEGKTIIENAAKEPEIVDLAVFINGMGGDIQGAGTSKIVINGVKKLRGVSHIPIYDRIEAGTYIVLAAITKSKFSIKGINEEYLNPILSKFYEMGLDMDVNGNEIFVNGDSDLKPINVKTLPHPGFPTDMQPQLMALLSITNGASTIIETIFENRFMHVMEMCRMGANISIHDRVAIIEGVSKLTPSTVKATDLRAGAALILSALSCEGESEITDIYHIDRGYSSIECKLRKLNADIERI